MNQVRFASDTTVATTSGPTHNLDEVFAQIFQSGRSTSYVWNGLGLCFWQLRDITELIKFMLCKMNKTMPHKGQCQDPPPFHTNSLGASLWFSYTASRAWHAVSWRRDIKQHQTYIVRHVGAGAQVSLGRFLLSRCCLQRQPLRTSAVKTIRSSI